MNEKEDTTLEEQFVPYDIAMSLKNLGFNELCFDSRDSRGLIGHCSRNTNEWIKSNPKCCSAPLYQQALEWLLEHMTDKEDFIISRSASQPSDRWDAQIFCLQTRYRKGWNYVAQDVNYKKAQEECIRELIEIVKEKAHEK